MSDIDVPITAPLAVRVLRDVVRALGLNLEHAKVADIAPAVEALRARVAELEAAARWVPVGERLPAPGDVVDVAHSPAVDDYWWRTTAEWDGKRWILAAARHWLLNDVTHWRPMPAGPEVQS